MAVIWHPTRCLIDSAVKSLAPNLKTIALGLLANSRTGKSLAVVGLCAGSFS